VSERNTTMISFKNGFTLGFLLLLCGCGQTKYRFEEDLGYVASAARIPEIELSAEDVSLKVYGLRAAKSVASREDFNSTLNVYLIPPEGDFLTVNKGLFLAKVVEHKVTYAYENAQSRDENVSLISKNKGIAYVELSTPGYHGSSGEKGTGNTSRGIKLISSALKQLQEDFEADKLVVRGQSSTGHIVAALLGEDISLHCAIIGSAPLDLDALYTSRPITLGWAGSDNPVNPIMMVGNIPNDLETEVYIGYNRKDKIVPYQAQLPFHKALKEKGLKVHAQEFKAIEAKYHSSVAWGYQKIFENCNS